MWHDTVLHCPGVTLRPLQADYLELLRQWRNSEPVKKQMISQTNISAAQQLSWFEQVATNKDQYQFVIFYKSTAVGACNVKTTFTSTRRSGTTGFYIGDEAQRGSLLAFPAAILLNEYCFNSQNFNDLTAQVRSDNSAALRFNEQLGYKLVEKNEDWTYLQVNKQQHDKAMKRFARFFRTPDISQNYA
ncbi:MAG: GNAT family N-acetyltransferase [Pseudomonadota bacterium]|nr:GNAT family N-acetyltransferase [Pseudomonadota bacterium]